MRRRSVAPGAVLTLVVVVVLTAPGAAAQQTDPPGPRPASPIEHFVYVMQESHSFDEYFGTYPGADGIPPGVCLPRDLADPSAGCLVPTRRGPAAAVEVRHVPGLFELQADGGRMDGFASAVRDQPGAAESVMAHHDRESLGWYWSAADRFVLFDRFFASSSAGHVANHMYWMAGSRGPASAQDAVPEGGWGDGVRTVFDELQGAGVSWKVYVGGYATGQASGSGPSASEVARVPILGMPRFQQDPDLAGRIVDLAEYFDDAQRGALPAVAFVVPSGTTSERPPADVDAGQTMTRSVVNELMRSPAWPTSALLLSYDTGGGSYDHVAPPAASEPFGSRVPALLVSPYAPAGVVDHTTLDPGSALTFISDNWRLPHVGDGTRGTTSLATALDLTSAPRPPELVPDPATSALSTPTTTSTAAIYPAYGLALVAPIVVAGATAWRARRRRSTT